jgi:RND family efflux transporter MFP subunit
MKLPSLKHVIWAIMGVTGLIVISRLAFPPPPKVEVLTLRSAPATQVLAVVGRAAPMQRVDVRPEAPGRAVQFLVDQGSVVTAGQVLAYIDAGEQNAALARAGADVEARVADASARAGDIAGRQGDVARQLGEVSARRGELAQRQSDLGARRADVARFEADLAGKRAVADLARRDLRRTEILAGRGYASAAALDSARAAYASAQANVETGQAAIRSSRAGVEAALASVASAQGGIASAQGAVSAARASVTTASATARSAQASVSAARAGAVEAGTRARRFAIVSPMAGTILERPVDPGQFVDSATTLFRIASGGVPEIETEIDEADADKLRVGTQAILSPTGSSLRIPSTITEISPEVNVQTGGRIVRLVPTANLDAFLPGRTIDVNFIVAKREAAILIPRTALINGQNVLRVGSNGALTQIAVTLLDWPGDQVAIDTGLKAGDMIVLAPAALKSKKKIKPIEASPKPTSEAP